METGGGFGVRLSLMSFGWRLRSVEDLIKGEGWWRPWIEA